MNRTVNDGVPVQDNFNETNIYHLSDEVLLMVFQYLETNSLVKVSRTCQRFHLLCYEKKFWRKIEYPFDDHETMNLIFDKFITPETTTTHVKLSSKIQGNNSAHRSSFCPSYLAVLNRTADKSSSCSRTQPQLPITISSSTINQNHLTHLSLIRQRIDGRLVTFKIFPETLKVLDLSGTFISHIREESAYFKGISTYFENLEELNLNQCNWVTSHALLAISKCPALTRLRLRGCRGIGNCVAYIALASRFGFKTLQVLDVTDTLVGSSDLISFAGIPSLVEFYFGQYDRLEDPLDHHIINDQSLAVLANSDFLQVIDMSGSMATDAVVDILMSIPNITNVYAHFTLLTEVGITRLRTELPNCLVHKYVEVEEVVAVPEL